MRGLIKKTLPVLKEALQRRGGGWRALRAVVIRGYKVFAALGWKGFVQRIQGASRRVSYSYAPPIETFPFPESASFEEISLRIGVAAHVFYPDLIDEFVEQLSHIPIPFVLLVSVVSETDKETAVSKFSRIGKVSSLHVRIVPNRGRDLAPLLVTYREEILKLDVFCHIHTKKSLYTGLEQGRWRQYLTGSLLGSNARIAWILGMFQASPKLGMVYPESFHAVPMIAHTWLSNKEHARRIGALLGIGIDGDAYLDFSAGSMFWVRTAALRPLYALNLEFEDFPEEAGQKDGTLQHAIERLLVQLVRQQEMHVGILPSDCSLRLDAEGVRNWKSYFDLPVADRISIGAIEASFVSFDIFDTLVVRPFLKPSGARAYLAWLVESKFGVKNFQELRERAESIARESAGRDVGLSVIYGTLGTLPGAETLPLRLIQELEVETERRILRPRSAVLNAARHLAKTGKPVVALSDMYLDLDALRLLLPTSVNEVLHEIHVSCETGWRKDTGQAWDHLPEKLGVNPKDWMHTGDNEHSDIQLPSGLGFAPPIHVLRPAALFDVVPALRPLRLTRGQAAHWPNQLVTGLIGNRLIELADREPRAFGDILTIEDPETFGYIVFGPLVADYLTWASRLASAHSIEKILFLSREGFLLQQAYESIQQASGAAVCPGSYLLASRRGIGVPSVRRAEDLENLLGGTYTGRLVDLLNVRFGANIAAAAKQMLADSLLSAEVYLPEMREQIAVSLKPLINTILEIADREREAYLVYWKRNVGDASAMVADIGYAGTIQNHLSRLVGRELGGAYFALNQKAGKTLELGWAEARYADQRGGASLASVILGNNLLLECIFTSPDDQFSHFERNHENVEPLYAHKTPRNFELVASIQQGVKGFVEDVCVLAGRDVAQVEFNPGLVQRPIECVSKGLWRPGLWISQLEMDDYFSGRGFVKASEI